MKRTTYILIGLFVAGLCVLVGGMFMIFCLGRPYISNQLNLQGEQITKEVPACRVVWLTQTRLYTPERNVWLANSLLEVQPSKEGKNLFSCSKKVNDYLKMTVMGDTLKILLDYSLDQLPQEFKKSKFMGLGDIAFFRILIGSTFSWADLVCYAVGCALFWGTERAVRHPG